MKKAIIKAWLSALRSGEYAQGQCSLYNPQTERHCCLGVLCRVANIELSEDGKDCKDDETRGGYGPIKEILSDVNLRDLWVLNDGIGGIKTHSFVEIADYIEKNILPKATEE